MIQSKRTENTYNPLSTMIPGQQRSLVKKFNSQWLKFNAATSQFVKSRLSGDKQVLFFGKRLLYCSWFSINFNSYYTSLPIWLCALSFTPALTTLVNQVSNWHLSLRKNLHSPRITAPHLRTRIFTIFSFDRARKSKSFSFPIFLMNPKESGQNKTTRAI